MTPEGPKTLMLSSPPTSEASTLEDVLAAKRIAKRKQSLGRKRGMNKVAPLGRNRGTTQLDVAGIIDLAQKNSVDRPFFIVSQNNRYRMAWDGVIAAALAYIFVMVPLELAYAEPSSAGWQMLGHMVDILFWLDICFCFCTTYFDAASGTEIYDRRKVAMNYIKDFFFIDVVCSIPGYPLSQLITKFLGESGSSGSSLIKLGKVPRVLKVIRGAKLLKMLRVMKIQRVVEDIQVAYPQLSVVIKLSTVLTMTLVFLHLNACTFSIVAAESRFDSAQGSWVNLVGGYATMDWTDEYLNAMYWAASTSTTVGYGDISPQNNAEKLFCIFSMCVGGGVYGYVIGIMTNIATDIGHAQKALCQKMDLVDDLSVLHRFPRELKLSLVSYFRNHYRGTGTLDHGGQQEIFSAMPYALLLRCRKFIMAQHLSQIAFFSSVSPKFFPALIELLIPVSEYGRILIAKHQPHQRFYILLSGIVAIQQPIERAADFEFDSENEESSQDAEAIKECRTAVAFMYKNNTMSDNEMDVHALHTLLNKMAKQAGEAGGKAVTLEKAKRMFNKIDVDKSGTVELGEFASWYLSEKMKLSSSTFSHFGHIKAKLTPVCVFGTWSAFDFGPNKYNYICEVQCDLYSVDADRFKQLFAHTIVSDLVQRYFTGPLSKYREEVDIVASRLKEKLNHRPCFRRQKRQSLGCDEPTKDKPTKVLSILEAVVPSRYLNRITSFSGREDTSEDILAAMRPERSRVLSRSAMAELLEADARTEMSDESPVQPSGRKSPVLYHERCNNHSRSEKFSEGEKQADMAEQLGTAAGADCSGLTFVSKTGSENRMQVQLLERLVQESEDRISKRMTSQFNAITRQLKHIQDAQLKSAGIK